MIDAFVEKTEDTRTAFGHTVFCDDIRQELGGKVSFIGSYSGSMIVHVPFPLILPKFGLGVSYFEKHGACSGPVLLRIYFPGDTEDKPSAEADLPAEEIRQQALATPTEEGGPKVNYMRLDSQLILTAVVIRSTGAIRVRAICGGEILRLGALRVRQRLPEQPASDPAARSDSSVAPSVS